MILTPAFPYGYTKSSSVKCSEHNLEYFVAVNPWRRILASHCSNKGSFFSGKTWKLTSSLSPEVLLHPTATQACGIVYAMLKLSKFYQRSRQNHALNRDKTDKTPGQNFQISGHVFSFGGVTDLLGWRHRFVGALLRLWRPPQLTSPM